MTETELERMVIRLMGDNEDYVEMLDDAVDATNEATADLEKGLGSIKMGAIQEGLGRAVEVLEAYDQEVAKSILVGTGMNETLAEFISFIPVFIRGMLSAASAAIAYAEAAWATIPAIWGQVTAVWALMVPLLPLIAAMAALVAVAALLTFGFISWWKASSKAKEEAKKLQEDVDKFTKSLQDEIEHLGKSAQEIELYELAKRGATEEQLKEAKAKMVVLDAIKEEQKANEERAKAEEAHRQAVEKATSEAEFNLEMIGKTAEEVQAAKLAQEGWTEAEIAHLQATEAAVNASKEYTAERDKAQGKIDDYIKKLREELAQMDMTETQREIAKAGLKDLSSAEREEIELLNETIAARKALTDAEKAHQDEVAKGQETVFKTIEGLQEQLATYGMTAKELALYRAQLAGADETERARIAALWDELEARKAVTKAEEDAKKVTEQFMTPLEKYNKKLEDLAKIRDKLSDETYERAVKAAQDELNKATKKVKTDVKIKITIDTSAVRAGTKEFDDILAGMQERTLLAANARLKDADPANQVWPAPTQPGGGAQPQPNPEAPPADTWAQSKPGEDSPVSLLKRIAEAAESLAERDGLLLTTLEG